MKEQIFLAGDYFHKKYPGYLIFYRLEGFYVSFQNDAQRAAKILQQPLCSYCSGVCALKIPTSSFLDSIDTLNLCGCPVRCVIYRGSDGKYSIPDVKILKKEEDMDY